MTILGISCYYHDAAAAIIQDGVVLAAAAEERFSRIKHDNAFPKRAIEYCLSWTQKTVADIDEVVFYEKPVVKFERILLQHLASYPKSALTFTEHIGPWTRDRLSLKTTLKKQTGYTGPVFYIPHHISHAAGAYYLSPFTTATVVTIDGVGEWATTTVGSAKNTAIKLKKEIRFPHSLGLLYSTITSYLGFEVNDAEYKVMGMAAYGDPAPFRAHFKKLITLFDDGSYALNMEYFPYMHSNRMYDTRLEQLFGYPPRPKESELDTHYANIAASLQEALEHAVIHILKSAYTQSRSTNLCLGGGVALNSVMNAKLLSRTPFTKLYIPPDPGDGGCAIGCALYRYYTHTNKRTVRPFFPALGPGFSDEQIRTILESRGLSYVHYQRDQLVKKTAMLLSQEKVIGWFQGRMEWGPRALGHRSILASARKETMKDLINAKIKHRELFRPFAPVILSKYIKTYFKTDTYLSPSLRYMLMVYPFTKKGKRDVPATVHVDGSGRLQTIEREDNELYFDIIDAYRVRTGIPVILNTSFNVRGEPIVCTPLDAIQCFLKTDIDYLVIGSYIVHKHPQSFVPHQ